ncbi:hypothetical protein [Desulfopila sp. IMCC35008]|uniref:hypothetical protein n=1 Tax=Desulfopila sp. IMCC35008 TaxID=2653858 RepID=UPI0013D61685|nr:hypothetical protein [Desulfopila sp. IMCC35008]
MATNLPTTLPGDTLRKAIQEYSLLQQRGPDKPHKKLLEIVAVKFDLSPLQCEFLDRQLKKS